MIASTVAGAALLLLAVSKAKKLKKQLDFTLRWTLAEAAARYCRSHGRVVRVELCGSPAFVTTHAGIIEHVMEVRPQNYLLRPGELWGLAAIGMLSQGIIWNQDLHKFKHGRACFNKALAGSHGRGTEIAGLVAAQWCASFGQEWRQVDMMEAMGELTVRVALPLFFGIHPDELDAGHLQELRAAIKGYFEAWEFFLVKPAWYEQWDWLRSACGGTSHCEVARSKVERVRKAVDQLLKSITPKQRGTSVFLESIAGLAHADQLQMCIELLLASADTSSVTLYYTLVLLARRPDVVDELRAEVCSVCGTASPSEEDCEHRLPRLTSALKESMRLKPVGPMILRTAVSDDVILVDGESVPVHAGTHFLLNIRDYHVDPEYFPDPLQIKLDRYMDREQDKMFIPFGKGPKSCVGRFLAMREMKVILGQVLQHLDFRTPDELDALETRWDIANHPISPAPFHVRRRVQH